MKKRITSLILAVLLLAGLVPAVLAVEEPSEPPPDTEPEGTVLEPALPEESAPPIESASENGITALASVPVSTDRTRQIQWVGHGNGRYNLTYRDMKPEQVFTAMNRVLKIIAEQGFEAQRMDKEEIKRLIAIYFGASMDGDLMPDVDGGQFFEGVTE